MLTPLLVLALQQPPVDFARDVQPIFREACWECHGADKQKADLRLDLRSAVFGEDPDLWVVVPGDPDGSLLLEVVSLPVDDPDRMPKDADPLTEAQVATLRSWIAAGAHWPESADAAAREPAPAPPARIELDEAGRAARDRILGELRGLRIAAHRVAADTDAVAVDLGVLAARAGDAELSRLRGLEPSLVRLDLGRTAVTDEGLAILRGMRELRRLDLSRTAVTDAGLAHLAGLAKLEWLNLFGTGVTDAGLRHLAGLGGLRKLHLWQTAVTDAGVARLREALPELAVERGGAAERLRARAAAEAAARDALNDTCPYTGKPVDPAIVFEHDGERTAFCSKSCCEKFAAEHGK